MDYRTIQGVDGEIRLDKVILGASSFGANISKELSYQMMDRYYEIGGRTIDTARFYAMWIHNGISKSEKTVIKNNDISTITIRQSFIISVSPSPSNSLSYP